MRYVRIKSKRNWDNIYLSTATYEDFGAPTMVLLIDNTLIPVENSSDGILVFKPKTKGYVKISKISLPAKFSKHHKAKGIPYRFDRHGNMILG